MITKEYRVSCEEFEGPLDLLLYLVRRQEVEIRDISLARITREYLLFIRDIDKIDFDGAGEFIRYAATLLALKARILSCVEESVDDLEYESKESLIRRLEEYRKFKERGYYLKKKLYIANSMFSRPRRIFDKRVEISIEELRDLFISITETEAFNPPTTILFHIEHLINKLLDKLNKVKQFVFSSMVKGTEHIEIVGTFFALLEIVRQGKAKVVQKEPFGEIWVKRK